MGNRLASHLLQLLVHPLAHQLWVDHGIGRGSGWGGGELGSGRAHVGDWRDGKRGIGRESVEVVDEFLGLLRLHLRRG